MAEQVFYTIAQETHVTYGMGDTGTALRVCKQGAYETGDFPPLFVKKQHAERYLASDRNLGITYKIIELRVVDG